ncbi:hypothetical protein BT69DRAFT_1294198 [Atractiella rhizophila]|nr:hypothetical protein BT69DRAFT_1294198 [Atractiella rhizophila]
MFGQRRMVSAGEEGLEVHDEQTDFAYTSTRRKVRGCGEEQRIGREIRFRGIGWIRGFKLLNSEHEQGWKGKRSTYDGVRRTRIGLMLAKEVGMKTREALYFFLVSGNMESRKGLNWTNIELPGTFEGQEAEGMQDGEKERIQ